MENNIGTILTKLQDKIGENTIIEDANLITTVSGYVDVGFIAFDSDGTMGVCISFTRDDTGNPTYVFRTCALNTKVVINNILKESY